MIAHRDLAVRDADLDERTRWTPLRRVVDKVGDRTRNAHLDAADGRRLHVEREPNLRIADLHVVDDLVRDLVESQLFERHRYLFVASDLDEIVDQFRHPLHLAHEIAEHLLSLGGIRRLSALEQLEVGAQAGERRAQLVRGVGDQLTLRAQRGFQLAKHGVEARAQTAQLVATVRRHAPREIAGARDFLDGRSEPLHRREDRTADKEAERRGEQDRSARELGEAYSGLRERAVDDVELLYDLDRAATLDRDDEHPKAHVLRLRRRLERRLTARGHFLDVRRHKRVLRSAEVGPDDRAARADDLRVDVRPASHESARWSEASLAGARPAASRVLCGQGEVAVDLFDQLVLHDEVHRDRRADRSDRDGRRDQEGDPKTEAHGSFIT